MGLHFGLRFRVDDLQGCLSFPTAGLWFRHDFKRLTFLSSLNPKPLNPKPLKPSTLNPQTPKPPNPRNQLEFFQPGLQGTASFGCTAWDVKDARLRT